MQRSTLNCTICFIIGLSFGWFVFEFWGLLGRPIINRLIPNKQLRIKFIENPPDFDRNFRLELTGNRYPTFWNGIHVLSWDAGKSSNSSASC